MKKAKAKARKKAKAKAKTKRDNKNSIFTALFSEKEKLLELYNAIENTNYGMDTDIRITTLKNVVTNGKQNDISFVINDKMVVLIEHQSTINENMPLRMLMYASDVYKKIIKSEKLYERDRMPIPKPEFIVMYNGKDEFPDHETYRLSDMFAKPEAKGLGSLELEVEVYNINEGRNAEMVAKSEALKGYSYFVYLLREYSKTMGLDAAAERAVEDCIRKDVLKEFLEENALEILNMLNGWKNDRAIAYSRKKGIAIGKAEGMETGIAIGKAEGAAEVFALLAQGFSQEEAMRKLGMQKQ